ncbi:MAG: NAD-dependent epimerase/dehydratase family protein, partial [bacterium]
MKILVTGGAGFIGSHVADAYVAAGHQVSVLDSLVTGRRENVNSKATLHVHDIQSPEAAALVARERFDLINHHAAQASVPVSVKDPLLDARVNILGLLNLLQAAASSGVKKVVFAQSGGTVYGPTDRLPAEETLPFDAASPYGVSKVASELYLRVYAREHGMKFTALRYANVYGPRQDPHGESGVVAIFSERMLAGGKVVVFGDGEYLRDYVYVGDVVRANVLALEKGDNEGINIGTGKRTSTNELFRTIKALTGYAGPETHGPERAGDLRDSCLAVGKAARVLGWEPRVGIEEGLRQTVEWF